jgi:hypothetical protein
MSVVQQWLKALRPTVPHPAIETTPEALEIPFLTPAFFKQPHAHCPVRNLQPLSAKCDYH